MGLWNWVQEGAGIYNTTMTKAGEILGIMQGRPIFGLTLPPMHTQYGKAIYFLLYTGGAFQTPSESSFTFPINPEDFNLTRQERVQVVQTLGDPFIDEFGTGLPTLSIRGTTGWRTKIGLQPMDGYEAYRKLHREVIDKYFQLRQARISAGMDPDEIRLILSNVVDNLVLDVVPTEFRLLRSRSKPLLYQYEMNFVVAQDFSNDSLLRWITDPLGSMLGWASGFISKIPLLGSMIEWSQAGLISPMSGFGPVAIGTNFLLNSASSFVTTVSPAAQECQNGAINSTLYSTSAAVENGARTVRQSPVMAQQPIEVQMAMAQTQSVFNEIKCSMRNSFTPTIYPDYSPINGTSDAGWAFSEVKSGNKARTIANGMEWVSSVREAVKRSNYDDNLIRFKTDSSAVEEAEVAFTVNSDLGKKLDDLGVSLQDVSTETNVYNAIMRMKDVLDCFTYDSSLRPDNTEQLSALKELPDYKIVVTEEGETLQEIALRELGKADRWREIAVLNNLVTEGIDKVYLPRLNFTIETDLAPGTNYIDYPGIVPTGYFEKGATLTIEDAKGYKQRITVKKVTGSTVTFNGTFSRYYTGPIQFTRYDNITQDGYYDYSTALNGSFLLGTRLCTLDQVKDIYPGYVIRILKSDFNQSFVVKAVNYLEKQVEFTETATADFPEDSEVLIFDTEVSMTRLISGLRLKIPVSSMQRTNVNQSDEEIFGRDIPLDAQGFIVTEDKDFGTVKGISNLKQAILHRIATPYRSLIPHPEYGCGLYNVLGEKAAPARATLAQATLIDAINREPRISRIGEIKSELYQDVLAFAVKVHTANQNTPFDLNLVLGVENVPN